MWRKSAIWGEIRQILWPKNDYSESVWAIFPNFGASKTIKTTTKIR